MRHFGYLDASEAARLCQLVQVFVAEKYWEGCGGLEMSDEIRVTIAARPVCSPWASSCEPYVNVETTPGVPSGGQAPHREEPIFATPRIVPDRQYLLGEARMRAATRHSDLGCRAPGRAFTPSWGTTSCITSSRTKLDMLDGAVDGVPPLGGRPQYERWLAVCSEAYEGLSPTPSNQGIETFLDPLWAERQGRIFRGADGGLLRFSRCVCSDLHSRALRRPLGVLSTRHGGAPTASGASGRLRRLVSSAKAALSLFSALAPCQHVRMDLADVSPPSVARRFWLT
jgi:hypothetical protein